MFYNISKTEAKKMSLTISTNKIPNREKSTAELISDYLKGTVKAMRRIDSVRRFYDKSPNRIVEHKEALRHMRNNPLRVDDLPAAEQLIDGARNYYEREVKNAPAKVKMEYKFGAVGALLMKDTLLYGAAAAVGGIAAAANGASPELICGAVMAAVGVVGVARTGAALVKMNSPLSEKDKKHPETLGQYTEAKQALFVLKMMKKQLAAQKKAGKTPVLPMMRKQAAGR